MTNTEYEFESGICQEAVNYCLRRFKLNHLTISDLRQQAWIGIHKAKIRYSPEKGNKKMFFYVWVKGEIRNYLRSRSNYILSYRLEKNQKTTQTPLIEKIFADDIKQEEEDNNICNYLKKELKDRYSRKEIFKSIQRYKSGKEDPIISYISEMQSLTPKPTLQKSIVLVDFSVLCWTIFHRLNSVMEGGSSQYSKIVKYQWERELFQIRKLFPSSEIVVGTDKRDDKNCYWRHYILPCYKFGRREKDASFYQVVEFGMNLVESLGIKVFSLEGLEFDDTAAIFSRCQREATNKLAEVVLYTIDSDLLQLVDDSSNIKFYTPRQPSKREKIQTQLRREVDVIEYADHHFKVSITSPKEIAKLKTNKGESADNIPPSDDKYLNLIDLYNCHIPEIPFLDLYKEKIRQSFFS